MGPLVHNKGTSVPAPGPARLRGGWRMKEEEEEDQDEEEVVVVQRAHRKRALAWDP